MFIKRDNSNILPMVVGRTTVKRKVTGSNLVYDDFSSGLCGYPGKELIWEESQ
jgi:hypothetical protein